MPDGDSAFSLRLIQSISDIPAADWDRCAGTSHPFTRHAFLSALEESSSAVPDAGWVPRHLLLERPEGHVVACVPLYLKTHSFGEYVFDHGWADAYERAGGRYYPKLQSSVPFTPVTGRRLLIDPSEDAGLITDALIQGLEQVATKIGTSSLHITFPTEGEWRALGEAGWLQRYGQQYHWENRGYGSFDDFLADLASRKRKNIRKERQRVAEAGIELSVLSGEALTEDVWDHFFDFYMDTGGRKWGVPYLTREFFSLLGERMGDQVALVMASYDGHWVAGALNLVGDQAIYGRNWGCAAQFKFLHFEACYYQAIDYAIAHGLATVEAGAQGAHKVQRGYVPRRTYSAHWVRDPGFRDAIADFLKREGRMVDWEMDELARAAPFRKEDGQA
jgi:hypothetical protein